MAKNRLVMFEWRTRDASRLKTFYGGLFKWKFGDANNGGWLGVGTGNDEVEGGMMTIPADPNLPAGLVCFFKVDDLAGAEEKVKSLGGQVVMSRKEIPGARYSLIRDVDFNQVGLWETVKVDKKARKAAAKHQEVAAKAAKKAAKAERKAAKAERKVAKDQKKAAAKAADEAKKAAKAAQKAEKKAKKKQKAEKPAAAAPPA